MPDPIPIVYVGGAPRSGSTVLAHLVAQGFGGVAIGELKDLWRRGPIENQRCSCGRPFRSCPFWTAVGREAFGGWDTLPLGRLVALQRRIDRFRTLPRLLSDRAALLRRDPVFVRELAEYRDTIATVYHTIQVNSGQAFIVESSKHPAQAFLLSASDMLALSVIHLVRDSRGVAWSSQKRVVRPEVVGAKRFMPWAAPVRTAWQWTLINLPFHLLWTQGVSQLRVRYESYARHPAEELRRIGEFLARTEVPMTSQSAAALRLDFSASHSLGGNPVRFNEEAVRLEIDEEWRTVMGKRDQLRVGILTSPMLAAYGYLGRGTADD